MITIVYLNSDNKVRRARAYRYVKGIRYLKYEGMSGDSMIPLSRVLMIVEEPDKKAIA